MTQSFLPPEFLAFEIGAATHTKEWHEINAAIDAVLDQHKPCTPVVIAMMCKFLDILEKDLPGSNIRAAVLTILAYRLELPLIQQLPAKEKMQ